MKNKAVELFRCASPHCFGGGKFVRYSLKFSVICLLILLVACGGTTKGTVISSGVDSRDYANLTAADAAAVAAGKQLYITQNYTISSLTTLTADIVIDGGTFTKTEVGRLIHAGHVSNPANSHCYVGFVPGGVTGLYNVRPEWFGAIGDGANYDGAAINTAIAAVPVGESIWLTSGKNYVVEQMLDLDSKCLIGYGATISRMTSTVDIPVTSAILADDSTTINVSVSTSHPDYRKLSVGMSMTFANNPDATRKVDPIVRKITAIDNGNITLVGSEASVASPANTVCMVNQAPLVKVSGVNVAVKGITFHGSKSSYDSSRAYWETGMTITGGAPTESCVIQDNVSYNAIADFCMIGGRTTVKDNLIFHSGGGGVHLSGTVGAKVTGNFIFDSNLNTSTGHNEAGIIFSAAVYDTLIANNVIDTCLSGIGNINSSWNSKVIISNNTIKNFRLDGFRAMSIPQEGLTNITSGFVITGNLIIGSQRGIEESELTRSYTPTNVQTKATGYGVSFYKFFHPGPNLYNNITIVGNTFQDCGVTIQNAQGFSLTGNSFVDRSSYSSSESTPEGLIETVDSAGVISANSIVSYPAGTWRRRIFTLSKGGAYASNIAVSGNSISTALPYYNYPLLAGVTLDFQSAPVDIYEAFLRQ